MFFVSDDCFMCVFAGYCDDGGSVGWCLKCNNQVNMYECDILDKHKVRGFHGTLHTERTLFW